MDNVSVKIFNESSNPNPEYATEYAAGCDVRASMPHTKAKFHAGLGYGWKFNDDLNQATIKPGGRALIGTGLFCEIPIGYEIAIRPRSGTALKGITVLNSPGTIDADYRNEIGVILINHSNKDFVISGGDRIAQFLLELVPRIRWHNVDSVDKLSVCKRSGGFGHTGTK